MKKFIKIFSIALIIISIAIYFIIDYAVENVLPYSIIRPSRVTADDIRKFNDGVVLPSDLNLKYEQFDITVEDTLKLKGWFIHSQIQPATGTIFLLHGIGNSKSVMLRTSKMLVEQGFNCVVYDSRANGESGGLNCTFGYYEKKDLSAYIDSAIVLFSGSGPFAVFGTSLGAAVAIQAMSEDHRIVCGIAQSPFGSLREIVRDYFSRVIVLSINSIPDNSLNKAEVIAHFSADSVQPLLSASKITQPTMIVHGLNDSHIKPEYGKQIYENLRSPVKIWYPIEQAGHNDVSAIGGQIYNREIISFFKKYLTEGL
ncbi:MAG: alpha/beta fold hydrolase [Ignavibacteriales bacterium]|nr:MAG: alpha/beta fold hydrolase [Ignavibacteriales bacterium]